MKQKFSLIIPVYNVEEYITECIESLLCQTYTDFEAIFINDASTDNSLNIVKEYEKKDARIKVIDLPENKGQGNARNIGIKNSSGDYILFVDSDDTIEQNYLLKINNDLKENQYDCLVIGEKFYNNPIGLQYVLPTWAIAVSRMLLEAHKDLVFPLIRPCEDGIFSHKILCLASNIGKNSNAKYNYRYRSNSSEHTLTPEYMISQIPEWFNLLGDFYDRHNLWEKCAFKLLTFIYIEPFGRFNYHIRNKNSLKLSESFVVFIISI